MGRRRIIAWMTVLLAATVPLAGCEQTEQTMIRSAADLAHARIGVTTGTVPAQIAHERFPEARIQEFGDFTDTLGALKAGHIDATITSMYAAILTARRNPDLRVIEESLQDDQAAIAVRKDDAALLADVNRVIAILKQDGSLTDMSRRWMKRDDSPYEEIEINVPSQGEPLRIGVSATREPFSFVDKSGRVTGHDGDLARFIGHYLNRPIEFVNVRFDALIPGLQSRKTDLIVTGMAATPERAKFVNFSDSYYDVPLVPLTRADSSTASEASPATTGLQLRTIADLAHRRIGVLQGSAFDVWAQQHFPEAELPQFLSVSDLFVAVEAGKIDAGMADGETLSEAMKTRTQLTPFGEPIFRSDVAAGFRKESVELRAQFDAFLEAIVADGTHADMERRWFELGDTKVPDIDIDPAAPPLLVGNAIIGLPQVAIQNNELTGYDVELAIRFAVSIGRRPVWTTVDWGALIPSLMSRKIDLIVSSMFITDERRERIDFSQPYHSVDSYLFVTASNLAGAPANATPVEPSFWESTAESFHANIIREDRYLLLWDGLKTTVVLSILSSLFGTLLGALVCYMRMSPRAILQQPARLYITLIRGTPVLVLLMLIFYVAFASVQVSPILVAVFAFGLNFAAYVSEIFRTGIQSIDHGQTEAGIAMGFTKVGTFRHIILPQTIQRILPVYKGEFISMVKMTSIVGYVAVQDLTKASDIIRSRTFDAFFPLIMVAVLYFAISWIMIQALEYLELRTDPIYRRRREKQA